MSNLNLEDWYLSDNQIKLISVIKHHVKAILVTPGTKQSNSLSWMFDNYEVLGQISLKECCSALEISISLIRIRMQYEIYVNRLNLVNVFNSQLPEILTEEILVHVNMDINALRVAKLIWCNPGINRKQLHELSYPDIDSNFHLAKLNKFIAIQEDKYYLPGRNVTNIQNINWAKCWSFYD
ncbi:MAG: hypothetical protein KBD37_08105 [Burkholderiales bacterium]|nr:hypothetical protein [Burkholderiales bacterium]